MARFVRLKSGNPKGRPPGRPDRRSALRDAIAKELPGVVDAMVRAALNGDTQAGAALLARCLPAVRSERALVAVDGMPANGTASDHAKAIVRAAAAGKLPADVASELVAAIAACARVVEIDDLEKRIRILEGVQPDGQ